MNNLISVNNLPIQTVRIPSSYKTSEELLRQPHKTSKSQSFMSFTSQYMSRDISRANNKQ